MGHWTNLELHRNATNDVWDELWRQRDLKAAGRFKYTPAEVPAIRGLAMLMEEVGEAARAILAASGYVQETLTLQDARTELIHVAAVATAMVAGLDDPSRNPLAKASDNVDAAS